MPPREKLVSAVKNSVAWPGGFGKQDGLGLAAQRPDGEPQPVQGGAAADDHLPARRVFQQLALGVGVQLGRLLSDGEPPRLRVVHRRRARRHLDQVAGLPGQVRCRVVVCLGRVGHTAHAPPGAPPTAESKVLPSQAERP